MPPYKTEYMLDLFILGPLWEYAMGMGLIVVIVPPLLHFLFLFSGDFPVPDRQTSWLPQSSAVVALIGTRQSQTGGWQGLWSSSCPRIGWWDAFIQDLRAAEAYCCTWDYLGLCNRGCQRMLANQTSTGWRLELSFSVSWSSPLK